MVHPPTSKARIGCVVGQQLASGRRAGPSDSRRFPTASVLPPPPPVPAPSMTRDYNMHPGNGVPDGNRGAAAGGWPYGGNSGRRGSINRKYLRAGVCVLSRCCLFRLGASPILDCERETKERLKCTIIERERRFCQTGVSEY